MLEVVVDTCKFLKFTLIRCTAFSKLMEDKGTVVGIEHISDLVEFSITNISKSNKKLLDDKKIILEVGDGRKGFKAQAPFNAIHVGAGETLNLYLKP